MKITVDVTSLVIGLIIGGIMLWLILRLTRSRKIYEPPETGLVSDLILIQKGLSLAFDILRSVRRPQKKSSISRETKAEDRTFQYVFDHLLERRLVKKADNSDKQDEYVLTNEGKAVCELFEEIYSKLGCHSADQDNRSRK